MWYTKYRGNKHKNGVVSLRRKLHKFTEEHERAGVSDVPHSPTRKCSIEKISVVPRLI